MFFRGYRDGFEQSARFQKPVRPFPLCVCRFQTRFPCRLTQVGASAVKIDGTGGRLAGTGASVAVTPKC